MARILPRLFLDAAPIALLAGAGVMALRGPRRRPRAGFPGLGGGAKSPRRIPLAGWKAILLRTRTDFAQDQISMIAAGVAFYALLALFPALGAFVALYGIFADVGQVQHHLRILSLILPGDAWTFIGEQMLRLAQANKGGLSFAFALGLLTSIWSANGAVQAVITGLNVAYEERETRNFLHRRLLSLAFTLGYLAFAIVTVAVLGAGPAVGAVAGHRAAFLFNLISWPLLVVGLGAGLALLYHFGPSRRPPRWRWATWGGAAALTVWLAVSALFSLYVGNFAHYDRTYGPLGAAVGFMMWSWLSSVIVLAGAELNSQIEKQTAVR